MRTKPHPEQGFRACLGILQLAKTYCEVRLEAACQRGLTIGPRTYGSVASILRTGLDRAFHDNTTPEAAPVLHANIRGRAYYHWEGDPMHPGTPARPWPDRHGEGAR